VYPWYLLSREDVGTLHMISDLIMSVQLNLWTIADITWHYWCCKIAFVGSVAWTIILIFCALLNVNFTTKYFELLSIAHNSCGQKVILVLLEQSLLAYMLLDYRLCFFELWSMDALKQSRDDRLSFWWSIVWNGRHLWKWMNAATITTLLVIYWTTNIIFVIII